MNPGEAIIKLTGLGYKFELLGDKVRYRYEGPGDPEPARVRPLLDLVRQHKEDVRFFLKCHCPRCGGVAFCPDLEEKSRCLACDWEYLTSIYPGLR